MAVLNVLRMGHPLLLEQAMPVTDVAALSLHQLIEDMFETMAAQNGAGLAAPQVGYGLRVVIFGVEANPRYPDVDEIPITVLINPEIEMLGDEMEDGWEGCLSIPGMRGVVSRYCHIRYRGIDQYGCQVDRTVSGFHARVVQHECDHLDGILYPQRIKDMRLFGFEDELFADTASTDDGSL